MAITRYLTITSSIFYKDDFGRLKYLKYFDEKQTKLSHVLLEILDGFSSNRSSSVPVFKVTLNLDLE